MFEELDVVDDGMFEELDVVDDGMLEELEAGIPYEHNIPSVVGDTQQLHWDRSGLGNIDDNGHSFDRVAHQEESRTFELVEVDKLDNRHTLPWHVQ
jgi:hypothetical protein